MPTVLRETEPTDFTINPATDMVSWRWPMLDGPDKREAMHYPLFVKTVFACLEFIERTNEARERAARAAVLEEEDRVIPLRKGVEG